jgi:hypothetical protein
MQQAGREPGPIVKNLLQNGLDVDPARVDFHIAYDDADPSVRVVC